MELQRLDTPEGFLRISWYLADTDCLGPDRRFALWVQGCRKSCKGCIAVPLQDVRGGELVPIRTLAERITQTRGIEGLSISGGEPFLQASGLAALLHEVRKQRPELGVIVYTGMLYEELAGSDMPDVLAFLAEIDLLVDGAYVQELDDGRAMRGSSNQRLLFLTARYDAAMLPQKRKNRIIMERGSFRMVGIPSNGARLLADTLRQPDKE